MSSYRAYRDAVTDVVYGRVDPLAGLLAADPGLVGHVDRPADLSVGLDSLRRATLLLTAASCQLGFASIPTLIAHGADPNQTVADVTPLAMATHCDSPHAVRGLVRVGASMEFAALAWARLDGGRLRQLLLHGHLLAGDWDAARHAFDTGCGSRLDRWGRPTPYELARDNGAPADLCARLAPPPSRSRTPSRMRP